MQTVLKGKGREEPQAGCHAMQPCCVSLGCLFNHSVFSSCFTFNYHSLILLTQHLCSSCMPGAMLGIREIEEQTTAQADQTP